MGLSQGRGTAPLATISLCLFVALSCSFPASATLWTVGGSSGWTLNYNYTTWAAGKTFKERDVLFFPYAVGTHDVSVVDQSEYTSCTTGGTTYSNGNTTITLNSTGQSFYICTIPGHCSAGMKLAIDVVAASAPVSSPSKAPPKSSPARSPSKAPAPSPKSAPAKSPTPSSSPSSSAAPPSSSPSGISPSSAPSPSASTSPPPPSSSSIPSSSATPPPPPSAATSLQAGATVAATLSILLGCTILIA